MGECLKCGKKVGFFTTKDIGLLTPLCSNCAKELKEVYLPLCVMLLKTDRPEIETEQQTLGRIAALHLLCAERANLVHRLASEETGVLEDHHAWHMSKAASIKFCKKALEIKNDDPDSTTFLQAILLRAESLNACEAPPFATTHFFTNFVKLAPSLIKSEHQAVFSGLVTIKDFEDLVKSIPGNQWLGENPAGDLS